jgi:hypothetical protein
MQSKEFTKPVTVENLLRAFETRFGQTMNLSGMAQDQLEDVANHIRTKIHTLTDNLHFGHELKNTEYQKSQSMLDIVNQAVKEAQGINTNLPAAQQAVVKKIQTTPGLKPQDKDQIIGAMVQKESEINEYDTPEKKVERDALMKHYLAKGGTIEKLKPGIAKGASHIDTRGSLKKKEFPGIKFEGIEQQSELILAAKDMMDKVTGYLQDLAEMKTEGMLELADRIRDEMGAEKADAFVAKILPAIESAEDTLTQTRADLEGGVRILTGEETTVKPMGQPEVDSEENELDLDTDFTADDEFGATDAEAGGTEPEGRFQRESREVFETTSRVMAKLAGK